MPSCAFKTQPCTTQSQCSSSDIQHLKLYIQFSICSPPGRTDGIPKPPHQLHFTTFYKLETYNFVMTDVMQNLHTTFKKKNHEKRYALKFISQPLVLAVEHLHSHVCSAGAFKHACAAHEKCTFSYCMCTRCIRVLDVDISTCM